jgi:hypothetical protein
MSGHEIEGHSVSVTTLVSNVTPILYRLLFDMQGGDPMCTIDCDGAGSVTYLKDKVEKQTGTEATTLALILPSSMRPLGESETLESCGFPSDLFAVVLHTVNIAEDVALVKPHELTDAQLTEACSSPKGQAGDIIDLNGCKQIHDMSCLAKIVQMQVLTITGCDTIDAATLVTMITAHK